MVMNIVSTLSRNDNFGGGGGGSDSNSHPPFQPNQISGPPGQGFVNTHSY